MILLELFSRGRGVGKVARVTRALRLCHRIQRTLKLQLTGMGLYTKPDEIDVIGLVRLGGK